MNDYIERTSNNTINDIQKNLEQLILEIQTLNNMIRSNEIEWENMIHLKKVKEELCFRLTRKKHLLEITSTTKYNENDNENENLEASTIIATNSSSGDNNFNDRIMQNQHHHQQQQQQKEQQLQYQEKSQDQHQQEQKEICINKIDNTALNLITSTPNNTNTSINSNLLNAIEQGFEQRLKSR